MKEEFLLNTMADIDDAYIREAAQPAKARKRKLPWKALAAAALIPLLTVTAYASDFMNVRTLVSGTTHYVSRSYGDMDRAMEKAGFQMEVKESFTSGFTFDKVTVEDTRGLDENDKEVLKYREIDVIYKNADGAKLYLHATPALEEITGSESPVEKAEVINGVTVEHHLDHYKNVPANYELTEEDKRWQEIPGNYISYGSDEVELTDIRFLCWQKDGVDYFFMDTGAKVTPQTLSNMAKELMQG